jgi:beta-glucanase (GH16 family)
LASTSDVFHVYKLIWSPERIVTSADGQVILTYEKPANAKFDAWPFDSEFRILLDTFVGYSATDVHGIIDDSIFPQMYTIDYIKYTTWTGQMPGPVTPSKVKWVVDRWSVGCDWPPGNELITIESKREECVNKCAQTMECTHFTWKGVSVSQGSCSLKKGLVKQENAINKADNSLICGFRSNE